MTRALHGRRTGAGPAGEPGRGVLAAPVTVMSWWSLGHRTCCAFAVGQVPPERWECGCGRPAARDRVDPPTTAGSGAPYMTHLQCLQQRRTAAEGAALLREALDQRQARRQAQRLTATRSAPRPPTGSASRSRPFAASVGRDAGSPARGTAPGPSVVELPATTAAPGLARRYLSAALAGADPELVEVAVLLTSELVTNAVRHGAAPVALQLTYPVGSALRVEVHDGGPPSALPLERSIDLTAVGGRGLQLVDSLARSWGGRAHHDQPGKVSWFEL